MLVDHIWLALLYLLQQCEVRPYLLSTLDLRKTKTSAVLECVCEREDMHVATLLETKPVSLFLHYFCISHGKCPKTDTAITI